MERQSEQLLNESVALHGHLCPGQVIGVRMALVGCQGVGVDEPRGSKQLIVYVEIDRCATDAIQSVTGCKLGKRTLKHVDYGKMAATFLNTQTGTAVRVSAREDARDRAWAYAPPGTGKKEAQLAAYRVMPEKELFVLTPVRLRVAEEDLPGHPLTRVACQRCTEGVNDRREVSEGGEALCRACAFGAYYQGLAPAPPAGDWSCAVNGHHSTLTMDALVLAGGEGRRMGSPKALLPVGSSTLAGMVVARLRPLFRQVLVVARSREGLVDVGATLVTDDRLERGPLVGLARGLEASGAPWCFVVGCDMPFLSPRVIGRMAECLEGCDILAPVFRGFPQPLHAFYSQQCLPQAQALLGRRVVALLALFSRCRVRTVAEENLRGLDPELLSFKDMDTQEEYQSALPMLLRSRGQEADL